jgi:hypothetical protein
MRFGLVTGFIGHFKLLIIIHYGVLADSHTLCNSLQHALHLPRLLSLHQSSATGLQRLMFPFLGSRTVPEPQPQQLLAHSVPNSWNLLQLPPLVTGHVLRSSYLWVISNLLLSVVYCKCNVHSVSHSLGTDSKEDTLLLLKLKLKLDCDRRSVGPVCLGVGFPLDLMTRCFCLSDCCGFFNVGHPIWREDGPVIYSHNCFWALPD